MTSPTRFEQDLPAILADLYVGSMPDYRDDLAGRIARTRQRPAWTFSGRWLPMDLVLTRPMAPLFGRPLVVVMCLLLAAALVAVSIGRQRVLPPPYGPAANGDLAYAVDGDILALGTDGRTRVLVGGPTDDHHPQFSPDGTRILFVRTEGPVERFWVAREDGSGAVQVLDQPILGSTGTAWSPDGRVIAIITEVKGKGTLFLVGADGSGAREVELGDEVRAVEAPVWRPDGQELLFRGAMTDGEPDLFIVRPDGSGLRGLGIPWEPTTPFGWDTTGPAWSPDGTSIAFNHVRATDQVNSMTFRVHLIGPDGADERPLPPPADEAINEGWPVFSPDGRLILVHRWTWTSEGEGWIALAPADGSRAARDIGPRIAGGEETGIVMRWSPDGSRITMWAENTQQTFSVDVESGDWEELPWSASFLADWQRRAHGG